MAADTIGTGRGVFKSISVSILAMSSAVYSADVFSLSSVLDFFIRLPLPFPLDSRWYLWANANPINMLTQSNTETDVVMIRYRKYFLDVSSSAKNKREENLENVSSQENNLII